MAARHLAAVPRPATRKKVDSIIRVTLSRDFRVVWENSVGTDALVRPQRDSAAGKNSFGISIPASVGRDALVPPTINRTPLSFRALAEKSPAEETRTSVHVMRRSEGEPPYRRLRSESDTIVIASEAWQSRGNERPPTRPRQPTCSRWLTAEKSPAEETRTSVHELPPILARAGSAPRGGSPPAGVPCRKKRFARFCRENRFSIYVIAFLRREPLISVSCGYTYSAFTAACFRD